ncbi:hypothetical protein HOK68_03450 [Candidatus Woesearchaeota archaeon]|jgi:hypothetical protein|nr:hypothetical protein [Candidatus Woesearchaeota archaeon]MBT4387400.1 hypothetical protein [Candidatus Woesearchaeota archaeon]MBT4595777.1 hypothetical protein [Candidatus Woesearchaeota archaeon]MBT5741374.1 hypothetical protein [Candidatus Woesearchaeota archaeon]MBT6505809.1 hypothetical protein [Candidatus Woesearchaeota archaeon]
MEHNQENNNENIKILEDKKEMDELPKFEDPQKIKIVKDQANISNNGEIKINIKLDDLKKVIEENGELPKSNMMYEETGVKNVYDELKKKYDFLPDFENIDSEFEISILEVNKFFLKNVRRRLIEKTDFFQKIIECYISGEPSIQIASETEELSENDFKKMNEIFKILSYYEKYSLHISLLNDSDEDAKFVKELFDKWLLLKPDLIDICIKLKNSWVEKIKTIKKVNYFN